MSHPQKPVSEKQLAANRANAAQSTGPRSPDGKPLMGISPELVNRDGQITQAQTEPLGVPSGPRAIEEFDRLKALLHDLPNEAIFPPNRKQTKQLVYRPHEPDCPANPAPQPPLPGDVSPTAIPSSSPSVFWRATPRTSPMSVSEPTFVQLPTFRPSAIQINTVHYGLSCRANAVGESPLFCWGRQFRQQCGK